MLSPETGNLVKGSEKNYMHDAFIEHRSQRYKAWKCDFQQGIWEECVNRFWTVLNSQLKAGGENFNEV